MYVLTTIKTPWFITCMIQSYRIEIYFHRILRNRYCTDVEDSNSFFPKMRMK
jgi:hypothetical protein